MSVQQKVGEGLLKLAVDKGGDAVRFGAAVRDDLLKSGIVKKFSDFEEMSQEDLLTAYNLRQNQLEQAEKNRVFNIKLKSEAKEEIKDDFDQTLDIFDEILNTFNKERWYLRQDENTLLLNLIYYLYYNLNQNYFYIFHFHNYHISIISIDLRSVMDLEAIEKILL